MNQYSAEITMIFKKLIGIYAKAQSSRITLKIMNTFIGHKLRKLSLLLILLSVVTGCAGPHNPFGAINPFSLDKDREDVRKHLSRAMLIKTYPEYQIYHRPFDLMVEVFDPEGIPENNFSLDFYYNGQKVQRDWEIVSLKKVGNNHLVAGIKNLKLLPHHKNIIGIVYSRHDNNKFFYYDYKAPECHMEGSESLFGLEEFEVSREIAGYIKDATIDKNYSPSFLAGIVAQESAFNPKAVSWAKAIGLTQVTNLAQEHILSESEKQNWPTYPDIEKLSYPRLRYLIMTGKIHARNEWRLNEKYSLLGGLDYVNYIRNYWQKENNQKLLQNTFDKVPITDIVLASYNSGPYRVKKALKSLGEQWQEHDELNAARHYVAQVKSYCYEFSKDKGDL